MTIEDHVELFVPMYDYIWSPRTVCACVWL